MFGAGRPALTRDEEGCVKNWWRRWSYEIPLAFSDPLWDVLVVQFAAFLDRLTLRKVLEFVAIAILAIAFAQTFPIDIAFLFAGDTLMYLEFIIAVRLAAGWLHLQESFRFALRMIRLASDGSRAAIGRSLTVIARPRESKGRGRMAPRPRSCDDSDGAASFGWGAFAAA
jgi:hypothetical protein